MDIGSNVPDYLELIVSNWKIVLAVCVEQGRLVVSTRAIVRDLVIVRAQNKTIQTFCDTIFSLF